MDFSHNLGRWAHNTGVVLIILTIVPCVALFLAVREFFVFVRQGASDFWSELR